VALSVKHLMSKTTDELLVSGGGLLQLHRLLPANRIKFVTPSRANSG